MIAIVFTVIWYVAGYDLSNSRGYEGALEASASMCSVLLGFIAAIFPVVLSLRSGGNYVDRVIKEGGSLLKSYNAEVVVSGFVLILVVLLNFFRYDTRRSVKEFLFFLWLFFTILFIGCCARCMYFLFRLVLVKDDKQRVPPESDAERRLKERVKNTSV